jgi:ankyrin repeat protein
MVQKVAGVLLRVVCVAFILYTVILTVGTGRSICREEELLASCGITSELHDAIEADDADRVLAILQASDGNADCRREALRTATTISSVRVLGALKESGMSLERADSSTGLTPLHYAVLAAQPKSVEFLISQGCARDARNRVSQLTPLELAERRLGNPAFEQYWPGLRECAELLRETAPRQVASGE